MILSYRGRTQYSIADCDAPRLHERIVDAGVGITERNLAIVRMATEEPVYKVARAFGISRARVYAIKKRLAKRIA